MGRRRSFIGPLVLVGLGLLLLYSSVRSNWSPWEVIFRYWPVILIAWGLGKLWDHLRARDGGEPASPGRFTGGELGMAVALVALVALALVHKPVRQPAGNYHFMQTVAAQGAKTVHAQIELGAGELEVSSGSGSLLEADCYYSRPSDKPEVSYTVSGDSGELDVRQPRQEHVEFGGGDRRNDWNLHFGSQVPLDLELKMGAGTGRLQLSGVPLTHLRVEGGAGTLYVDLTGDWKQSFDGRIAGGVGTVTVRLPSTVGVQVHARGGLGSVNAPGFERDGDAYTNSAYGKSPVTLTLDIEGGVGTINLESGS
ncbi:MAG: hypothetical protein KGL59_01505 [Acidobacteriota bacterium]|nr:hypothetical protein [Acidobacteriota bacterium]